MVYINQNIDAIHRGHTKNLKKHVDKEMFILYI